MCVCMCGCDFEHSVDTWLPGHSLWSRFRSSRFPIGAKCARPVQCDYQAGRLGHNNLDLDVKSFQDHGHGPSV